MSNWPPNLGTHEWMAPADICSCECPMPTYGLEYRSISARLYQIGYSAFDFLNDNKYKTRVATTTYANTSVGPFNGAGHWDASEEVSTQYDDKGNVVCTTGTVSRSWLDASHMTLGSSPVIRDVTYSESFSIDDDGCMSGSWTASGFVVSSSAPWSGGGTISGQFAYWPTTSFCSSEYDCDAGPTWGYPTTTVTATLVTETWSHGSNTFDKSDELSDAANPTYTLAEALGSISISDIPWGCDIEMILNRYDHSTDCLGVVGNTSTDYNNEISALDDLIDTAAASQTSIESDLTDAETALTDYLDAWALDHAAYQAEQEERAAGTPAMSDPDFADLVGLVFAKGTTLASLYSTISSIEDNLAQASNTVGALEFAKTKKTTVAYDGSYKLYPELGAPYPYEGTDYSNLPSFVDGGHAQVRLRLTLSRPASTGGESFDCLIGGESATCAIAEGDYIGYTTPVNRTISLDIYDIEITRLL